MIKDTDLISVRNRNNGTTGYTLDGNFHRDFSPKEIKKVPFSELKQLSYAPGGQYILDNYLVIENKEALDLLNMKVEPEYFYDETKVKNLLLAGSIDEFADFLDFAPDGAIDIAKKIAVEEEIPDIRKRDMLSEKTGLNINNAIMINHVMNEDDNSEEDAEEAPKRRVAIKEDSAEPKTPQRRVAAPKYNVTKIGN